MRHSVSSYDHAGTKQHTVDATDSMDAIQKIAAREHPDYDL